MDKTSQKQVHTLSSCVDYYAVVCSETASRRRYGGRNSTPTCIKSHVGITAAQHDHYLRYPLCRMPVVCRGPSTGSRTSPTAQRLLSVPLR